MPVFGFGQQHAGEEGAQAGAEAGQLHQPGAAQHHQQRRRGEHLGHARARDDPEQVPQQHPAAQHQRRDRGDREHESLGLRGGGRCEEDRGEDERGA